MGLETWFHPTVDVQRSNEALKSHIESFSKAKQDVVIQPGDLLHCDFGITYITLNTDCQQHAYVLKEGETKVPDFLAEAFKKGNIKNAIYYFEEAIKIEPKNSTLKKLVDLCVRIGKPELAEKFTNWFFKLQHTKKEEEKTQAREEYETIKKSDEIKKE